MHPAQRSKTPGSVVCAGTGRMVRPATGTTPSNLRKKSAMLCVDERLCTSARTSAVYRKTRHEPAHLPLEIAPEPDIYPGAATLA